jgi:DNA-binding NtrC family response regulator
MSDGPTRTLLVERDLDEELTVVRVTEGPDAPQQHLVLKPRVSIGTSAECDVRLSDSTVSRFHAELVRGEGGLRFRDLGSKNGSWLGSTRVYDVELVPELQIRIGASAICGQEARRRIKGSAYAGGEWFGALYGASAPMQALFAEAARIAPGDEPLLIRGESGTGKSALARAIHDESSRREGPFVVLDAATLSTDLADLEIFGHARGAFTGATADRPGAFERAHGGTLLLDEVGELAPDVQRRLLRVVEDRTVQRLGDPTPRPVDVRIVAATHAPLEELVNRGGFREDLLFRLRVIELWMPPLRMRRDDLLVLALGFARELAPYDASMDGRVDEELSRITTHRWPGNLRELRAFVRRLVWLGSGGALAPPLPEHTIVETDLPYRDARDRWLVSFDRKYFASLLAETRSVELALERSGLSRSRFYALLQRAELTSAGEARDDEPE